MKKKETEKSMDRHVRITDISLLEQFDKIMQVPEYKSFNKVLNDALLYGLPILHDKLYGPVEIQQEPQESESTEPSTSDKFYLEVVRLLKEIILTNSINKSMLASIFNALGKELNGETVSGKRFEDGLYAYTPDYLELYEIRGLKNIRQSE